MIGPSGTIRCAPINREIMGMQNISWEYHGTIYGYALVYHSVRNMSWGYLGKFMFHGLVYSFFKIHQKMYPKLRPGPHRHGLWIISCGNTWRTSLGARGVQEMSGRSWQFRQSPKGNVAPQRSRQLGADLLNTKRNNYKMIIDDPPKSQMNFKPRTVCVSSMCIPLIS